MATASSTPASVSMMTRLLAMCVGVLVRHCVSSSSLCSTPPAPPPMDAHAYVCMCTCGHDPDVSVALREGVVVDTSKCNRPLPPPCILWRCRSCCRCCCCCCVCRHRRCVGAMEAECSSWATCCDSTRRRCSCCVEMSRHCSSCGRGCSSSSSSSSTHHRRPLHLLRGDNKHRGSWSVSPPSPDKGVSCVWCVCMLCFGVCMYVCGCVCVCKHVYLFTSVCMRVCCCIRECSCMDVIECDGVCMYMCA